ncbi:hypothetical protein TNCT_515101 [Trichonephila clavata]|uniref:Uncharacterized protein n=1 Tax=Trichonephila clavata TaxID=2740835 RepID=A0A8X6H6V4_TRICU|nr:hypothetical protein TNCT_515101 [Trichonephila clavata]
MSMLLKEGPRGIANGQRGECHPQFRQGHQQGRGPVEKKSTKDRASPQSPVPVRHEHMRQSGNDQFGPDKSNWGGQVPMSCVTNVSAREDKRSPESSLPVHHKELLQLRKDLSDPDKSSLRGQVRMICAAGVSSVEGKNNSGGANSCPTSDAARKQPTKESILS